MPGPPPSAAAARIRGPDACERRPRPQGSDVRSRRHQRDGDTLRGVTGGRERQHHVAIHLGRLGRPEKAPVRKGTTSPPETGSTYSSCSESPALPTAVSASSPHLVGEEHVARVARDRHPQVSVDGSAPSPVARTEAPVRCRSRTSRPRPLSAPALRPPNDGQGAETRLGERGGATRHDDRRNTPGSTSIGGRGRGGQGGFDAMRFIQGSGPRKRPRLIYFGLC